MAEEVLLLGMFPLCGAGLLPSHRQSIHLTPVLPFLALTDTVTQEMVLHRLHMFCATFQCLSSTTISLLQYLVVAVC